MTAISGKARLCFEKSVIFCYSFFDPELSPHPRRVLRRKLFKLGLSFKKNLYWAGYKIGLVDLQDLEYISFDSIPDICEGCGEKLDFKPGYGKYSCPNGCHPKYIPEGVAGSQ